MQVSKLLMWSLALLAALCFALTPVMAGEHPWSEDEGSGGSADDGGEPENGGQNPDYPDGTLPDELDPLFGTTLWWLDLIWDEVSDEDENPTSAVTGEAPDFGVDSNSETGGVAH